MSIKRFIKKIAVWYENLAFLKKIIYVYLVCGVLPIVCMMIYFYHNTVNLLLEQTYSDIRESVTTTVNSLDMAFSPYTTIIENLKNDKNLNTQLNVDYTSFAYTDLSDFIDDDLDTLKAVYPYLSWVRFYSSNETLPDDNNYFYTLDEMNQEYITELKSTGSSILFAKAKNSSDIVMVSAMNYYSTEKTMNYLTIGLSDELLDSLLQVNTDAREIYLVDNNGEILWSSADEAADANMADLCAGWAELESGEIINGENTSGEKKIYMSADVDMGLHFIEEGDREAILAEARKTPLIFSAVMALITLILLQVMVFLSKMQQRRLQGIIGNMEKIGSGDFSEKLNPIGNAEFGQIETAVNHMSTEIDDLIQTNYKNQLAIQSTELNLLQEQINPHFLYNALGVISSLSIREGGKATVQSIRYLADFYRISLNKGRSSIHVSEEIDLLRNYMQIQLLRFSDMVEIFYDVDPAVNDYYTIKLLLQPLVENAIHHAREEEMFMTIRVSAYPGDGRVCFDVADNGMGIDPEKLKILREQLARQEEGFGLKNVDKRIKLAYGQQYGLTIFSEPGKGTRIHLEIPALTERKTGGQ